jgi:hypothetical protein
MGNGNITADKKTQGHNSKGKQLGELFQRKKSADNLIFFACTDKARV